MGEDDGAALGCVLGAAVEGESVGPEVGDTVVGAAVEGESVGIKVGDTVVGAAVEGEFVGVEVGEKVVGEADGVSCALHARWGQ